MKTIQRTSRALAAAVSVACMFPAFSSNGATLTINDSSCASFSQTSDGSGGLTITCGTGTGTGTGVPPPPPPPPPPTGGGTPTSCPGFSNSWSTPIAWGPMGSGGVAAYTKSFSGNDIVVASFTTPAATSAGQIGAIQAAEFSSSAISRTASLSLTPCSFDTSLSATGPFSKLSGSTLVSGNTVTVSFVIGGSSSLYPVLQPNTTYYFNIKNTNAVGGNMKIEMIKPPGL
jgi:hypothetical protein